MDINLSVSLLTLFFIIFFTTSNEQTIKEIDQFIKKKKTIDFRLNYSTDNVPYNLSLLCKGLLVSANNQQISIPSELISHYISSNSMFISDSGRIFLLNKDLIKNDTVKVLFQLRSNSSISHTLSIPVNY